MVAAPSPHPGPWTVADLYALPDDGLRYELVEGTLLVSPPPAPVHQLAARRLATLLAGVLPPSWEVVEAVGVSVPGDTFLIPDVVVADAELFQQPTGGFPPDRVTLVAEIVSPSSRRADRQWKPELYAEAGIPAYWRVELQGPDSPVIVAYALERGRYMQVGHASRQETLRLAEPFVVEIAPASLVGPQRS